MDQIKELLIEKIRPYAVGQGMGERYFALLQNYSVEQLIDELDDCAYTAGRNSNL